MRIARQNSEFFVHWDFLYGSSLFDSKRLMVRDLIVGLFWLVELPYRAFSYLVSVQKMPVLRVCSEILGFILVQSV